MNWTRWRRLRQATQWATLSFYVYLLFAALQRRIVFPLADLFFRLDPLIGVSAIVAARVWIPRLLPVIFILALTFLFGRVWCGWLCPLGTILDLLRFRTNTDGDQGWLGRLRAGLLAQDHGWRRAKYLLLFLLMGGFLFGNLTLLILDPLTILTRTMTTAILPTLNRLVTGATSAAYDIPLLRPAVDSSAAEVVFRAGR